MPYVFESATCERALFRKHITKFSAMVVLQGNVCMYAFYGSGRDKVPKKDRIGAKIE